MHTIKYWIRLKDNPTIKHFDNSEISEVFWWLKYLQDNGFNYTHTHIDR